MYSSLLNATLRGSVFEYMGMNLKIGGTPGSVTASTALLNQKLASLSTPRMLTPSEVVWLRKSKQEIAARYTAIHK